MKSESATLTSRRAWHFVKYFLFAIVYALAVRFGFAVRYGSAYQSTMWIASGVLIIALVRSSPRQWPIYLLLHVAISLGIAHRVFDSGTWMPTGAEALTTAIDALKACAGAVLIRRFIPHQDPLHGPREFGRCVIGGTMLTAVSATLCAPAVASTLEHQSLLLTWRIWWLSDALGIMTVAPAVLSWCGGGKPWLRTASSARRWEYVVALIGMGALAYLALAYDNQPPRGFLNYPIWILPVFVWLVTRFHASLVAVAVLMLALVAVIGLVAGAGPFVHPAQPPHEHVLAMQTFMFCVLISQLGLAAFATERDRKNTEALIWQRELLEAQKREAIGTISAGLAHNFASSLLGMDAFARALASESATPGERARHLHGLHELITSARAVTRPLMGMAHEESRAPELHNLAKVLTETRPLLARVVPPTFSLVIERAEACWAHIHISHVQQALINLVTNAADAMPEGGRITLRANPADTYAELAVSDAGTGMSPELRERVAEPFFTTKQRGQGTGLGLATVFAITRNHGGEVRIDSTPNRGTCVGLRFPLAPPPAPSAIAPPGPDPSPDHPARSGD
jgi:signal transduction histidine kinase